MREARPDDQPTPIRRTATTRIGVAVGIVLAVAAAGAILYAIVLALIIITRWAL